MRVTGNRRVTGIPRDRAGMVAKLITPQTKVIILNSPSNPSGAVMSAQDHDGSCAAGARARNLGAIGRVLCLSELHGQEFFRGIAAGISRIGLWFWDRFRRHTR